jgi:hypothetical protein
MEEKYLTDLTGLQLIIDHLNGIRWSPKQTGDVISGCIEGNRRICPGYRDKKRFLKTQRTLSKRGKTDRIFDSIKIKFCSSEVITNGVKR